MSEAAPGASAPGSMTAGRLLREARQAQGLHIAALANAIKVTPQKLESLEADRFDELPDATFTRALAQTVCRSLKIDAAPVLALLPPLSGYRIEQLGEGLNTPFRERPSAHIAANEGAGLGPTVWGPVLVLLVAGAVYVMPSGWLPNLSTLSQAGPDEASPAVGIVSATEPRSTLRSAPTSISPLFAPVDQASPIGAPGDSAAGAASGVAAALPSASVEVTPSGVAAPVPLPAVSAAVAAVPASLLRLRASADSWIEVVDARGQTLLSRVVRPGETVDLDGTAPLKLRIGNVAGTEVVFRGQALELAPYDRGNLARFELK